MMPDSYTGRAGIPSFQDLGRFSILRISTQDNEEFDLRSFITSRENGLACYRRLSFGRYSCPVGEGEERSQITPLWLMNADGSACGMLEDTRRAKQLITGDGLELLSAHLSCFAYRGASAAAELIGVALRQAARLGLPALFVSVAEADSGTLRASLDSFEVLAAPAIVYGTGLAAAAWNINSSEI